jgi:hypothetical protein
MMRRRRGPAPDPGPAQRQFIPAGFFYPAGMAAAFALALEYEATPVVDPGPGQRRLLLAGFFFPLEEPSRPPGDLPSSCPRVPLASAPASAAPAISWPSLRWARK